MINILDTYNERMQATDEEKVIAYTDYVGTLMSSVTDIVNVISYVLVAFVAISVDRFQYHDWGHYVYQCSGEKERNWYPACYRCQQAEYFTGL